VPACSEQEDDVESVLRKARHIRLLALDCDGVLTDGRLWYGNNGEELKAFHILDGLGIKLLRASGVEVAIITGRRSELLRRRATELGVTDLLLQGREDKLVALNELLPRTGLALAQVAYCGDDLPDLAAILACGLGIAPANAHGAVADRADWVTRRNGGEGAVREICDLIMEAQGTLDAAIARHAPGERGTP
jgi:3-deoxy-D-manno-octulosonate 8-phosphate phosphatase (KDO 8-P phosphatase)